MVATFKIITMSSAVEEKVIDIFNDTFYDFGSVHVNGTRIEIGNTVRLMLGDSERD